jgi:iron-only hydrogenase group A
LNEFWNFLNSLTRMEIKINRKKFKAKKGERVIDVCRREKISVVSLCDHEDFVNYKNKDQNPDRAVCRLCLVKVKLKGQKEFQLVPSCEQEVTAGLEVVTEDAEIIELRKTNLELLFADHAGLCANCHRNGDCVLQDLARRFDIDEYRFVPHIARIDDETELDLLLEKMDARLVDNKNVSIHRDSLKCINCRRCVRICRDFQTVDALTPVAKGKEAKVGTEYNQPLECTNCGQCTTVCPTAALTEKNDLGPFLQAVNDSNKLVVVQTAPSVRVALGEEAGLLPGTIVTGKIIAALRETGADLVFDTNFAADLTIMEEATELVSRLNKGDKPLPMFTSCCPAWVLFLERYYPEFLPHLSSCRSPQMMLASLVKNYWAKKNQIEPENIFNVSLMPCTAKKFEISRKEFKHGPNREADCVLTTREFGRLLRMKKIDLMNLEDSEYDPALGVASGAGFIFGASGGVTEAALRTAHHLITGQESKKIEFEEARGSAGIRKAQIKLGDKELKVKVVHGLGNARQVLEEMKAGQCDFDFLEVMACPNGCIGGGGQPIPTSASIRKARAQAIYAKEKENQLRRSHENPVIKRLYEEFLIEPGSRKAEKFLHTRYHPRDN